ncbi:beta-hydroxyacyl-ACP dehydratase [Aquitalea denitrificans]|uniref:beta-hydroxyacyl-ACP dehydratase n=1 Tax=Aquitalea denitrificans TaxID=519081 RepID=UPI00135B4D30|nr:beta-hydroxyacyl-ACP dehydratase [Aquitalea denitrificans]
MQYTELQIAADHPAYPGHFPGRPILPGVVLLDQAQLVIEAASGLVLTGLALAKFHRPVAPGEALQLAFAIGSGNVSFVISHAGSKVADGKFLADTEPAA